MNNYLKYLGIILILGCQNSADMNENANTHDIGVSNDTLDITGKLTKSQTEPTIDSALLQFAFFLHSKGYSLYDPFPNPGIERNLDTLLFDPGKKILIYKFNLGIKQNEYFDSILYKPHSGKEYKSLQIFVEQLAKASSVSGFAYHKSTLYLDAWQFNSNEESRKAKVLYDKLNWMQIFPKTYSTAVLNGKVLYVFHAFTYGPSLSCKKHSEWFKDSVLKAKSK